MRTDTLSAIAAAALATACAGSRAQQPTTQPPVQAPISSRHPYEMKGRVASVGGGFLGLGHRSIAIGRDEAPEAVLHVVDGTRVSVNGRQARLGDVRAGDDVRAVFDFDEDRPTAIQIEAKTPR